jgi:predicted phosphoribosyltransferase
MQRFTLGGLRRFAGRREAGRILAGQLAHYAGANPLVLALPRGGVPVAYEVARALGAELDVMLVRKLGFPGQPELAMGAIASGGVRVLNDEVVRYLAVPPQVIDRVAAREQEEMERRRRLYRPGSGELNVRGRTVILVDDGLATGSTMRAAARAARTLGAERVVIAVPVATREACTELAEDADEVVCTVTPEPFYAVGAWYQDFSQVSDEEVIDLLAPAGRQPEGHSAG